MWQAPNQRLRAIAIAKKRERERLRRPIHICRVTVNIKILSPSMGGNDSDPVRGRVLLNDISPKGMGIYASHPMSSGQEISIQLAHPVGIEVRGRVVWCQAFDTDSKVLTNDPFSFRLGIQFIFNNPAEEQALQTYCDQIAKDVLFASSKRL